MVTSGKYEKKTNWGQIAAEIVAGYTFSFKAGKSGFIGFTKELPGVVGEGSTYEECLESTREAQVLAVETLLRRGLPVPEAGAAKSEQLNLRLSADDKRRLQGAATLQGFRSVSDFVRAAALKAAAESPPGTAARRR